MCIITVISHLRDQCRNVFLLIGVRVPDSRPPGVKVRVSAKGGIDGMETVAKDRVPNGDLRSIVVGDFDLFQLDYLVRGNKRETCVPVWLTQILGRLSPFLFMDGKLLSNPFRSFLEDLLLKMTRTGISHESDTFTLETNFVDRDINPVPSRKENLAVGTVSRFVWDSRGILRFSPGSERQTVNTRKLEKRAVVSLILILYSLCLRNDIRHNIHDYEKATTNGGHGHRE